jgi:putative iron-dependent peroxidase
MSTLERVCQPNIIASFTPVARMLTFRLLPEAKPQPALQRLREGFSLEWGAIGIGEPTIMALGATVPGLRTFPGLSGPACAIPSTQGALWVFLRGEDRGTLVDRTDAVRALVGSAFSLEDALDTFVYKGGRDLTGYEDGTENPKDEAAVEATFLTEGKQRGASFVAVQRWVHDLAHFRSMPPEHCDHTIGRRISDNEEIDDAPVTAHVKRTAQESFDPPAFMYRRSMPWATGLAQGIEFIAYCESLDRYERVLRRMAGLEDGLTDALFTFSRPITGSYYWCPPVAGKRLDLSAIGVA